MNRLKLTHAAAGGLLALALAGCDREATTADTMDETTDPVDAAADAGAAPTGAYGGVADTPAAAIVNVADITENPAAFSGKTVTIVADVEAVHGPRAFSLDEDSLATGGIDNELLVVGSGSANLATIDDQWVDNTVRVTGVVHQLAVVELEREIGWDLDPQVEAEIEDQEPILMATAVERMPGS